MDLNPHIYMVHDIGYWCSLRLWKTLLNFAREHREDDYFQNIGGSTTRASYRPIEGHNMSLQGFEPGWKGDNHSSQPPIYELNYFNIEWIRAISKPYIQLKSNRAI